MSRVHSFDVFDTLLTRCVFQPSDLFLLLGCRLRALGLVASVEEFRQKRIIAEQEARRQTSREEVTFQEINIALARSLGWTRDQAERAMQEELLCERRSLIPVAAMVKQCIQSAATGARVLFISDTYLPEGFIKEQLRAHISVGGFGLYVSSAIGLTKHSGHLFTHIANREHLAYRDWQHRGDNPYSDVLVPQKLGIVTLPTDYESVTRYEATVSRGVPRILASTLSGSMRATRLSQCLGSMHYQDVWNLACDVVGPTFLGFCYWLLSSALRDQVQRLYFVARDGQILLKLAQTIQEAVPEFSGIECRYLYGSRQAWHLPAVSGVDAETLNWIFANTTFLSVDVILDRLGQLEHKISPSVQDAIADCIPVARWGSNLSKLERLDSRHLFEQSEEIHQWITRASEQARTSALGYLIQEGLCDGSTWAMVDIGWNGRLQNSLSRILSLAGCSPQQGVWGYYWGLATRSPYQPQDRQIALTDELPKAWRSTLFYHAGLYEAFASADHGSTVGYSRNNSKWMPILRDSTTPELVKWGVPYLQEGVVAFAGNFLRNWQNTLDIQQYMSLILPLLKQFFFQPTCHEIACLRARPMYECQTESMRLDLIPESSAWSIMRYWIRGESYPDHGVWPHAVIVRQPLYLRVLMRGVLRWNKILVLARYLVQRARALRIVASDAGDNRKAVHG